MDLRPDPLVPGAFGVSYVEAPYGYHRSPGSMVLTASVPHAAHVMHNMIVRVAVCIFIISSAGCGAPRLCIGWAFARGTVPMTVDVRATARPRGGPRWTHQPSLLAAWPDL